MGVHTCVEVSPVGDWGGQGGGGGRLGAHLCGGKVRGGGAHLCGGKSSRGLGGGGGGGGAGWVHTSVEVRGGCTPVWR